MERRQNSMKVYSKPEVEQVLFRAAEDITVDVEGLSGSFDWGE